MKRIYALTAAMALAAVLPANAQTFADRVIDTLAQQGFRTTEVKNGPTQTKVEAIRGTTKLEVVYDRSTGQIVKQETEPATARDLQGGGIEISTRDRDFARDARRDDDDDDDNRGRRGGRDDDDDDDDDRSGRRGGDDDDNDRSGRGGGDDDRDDDDDDDDDDNSGPGSNDD
ncbi:PepSY domain-containing protein [Ruegeria sp. HKCCD8929]|uniref:PepSY domain-containing protein n=1 Tax=Ruegeria sp. HKCCD8929 TaxID=2683006 RepID=UPI0014897469|nr:PepSY domain-containing protein [Ruegeria sp. HKCCD8929]